MMQGAEQTHEEKVAMYDKCTKEQLIIMLIEANRVLDMMTFPNVPINFSKHPDWHIPVTCESNSNTTLL